ncbi:uncharacterized protein [Drosophila tropicalis]|uniref:uncharacterized protein n=1 Tax=Drosophila tropicalis TaxID=46794 RepID=UPI0035AC2633
MTSEPCDSRISERSEDLRTNSCGSLYANCNCNSGQNQSLDKVSYDWNRLRVSVSDAETMALTRTFTNTNRSPKHQLQFRSRPRREHNSFSHPDTDVVFTKLSAIRPEAMPSQDWDGELRIRLSPQSDIQKKTLKTDFELSPSQGHNKIERAQQFFAQSGILGPTNFRDSSDLIRKTSRIHTDPIVREQIRKTSLCLRSKVSVAAEKSPLNVIGSWPSHESTNRKSDDPDILTNLQEQVYTLRDVIEHGETKIIMLRTEISKMKEMTQSHALCLFCQPEVEFIDS